MEDSILHILLSAYGTTLVIIIGILIKILWKLSDKQSEQGLTLSNNSVILTKIENQEIPTIRIQIEKLDKRTDTLEYKQELTDQRVKWLEKETDKIK